MNLQEPFWQIFSFLLAFYSLQHCTKTHKFLDLSPPPPIFFFFCQQHWQSNLNEILQTDIFLTREKTPNELEQKKEFWHLLLGDLSVIRYHHPNQFPLTRLSFMGDRWWTPPLVFHTCRCDIFLTLGHWGRTRWEQDYQILIRGWFVSTCINQP